MAVFQNVFKIMVPFVIQLGYLPFSLHKIIMVPCVVSISNDNYDFFIYSVTLFDVVLLLLI